jgi:hypothetical protein
MRKKNVDSKGNDRAKFMETLKVAGSQAVDDFARMVKI